MALDIFERVRLARFPIWDLTRRAGGAALLGRSGRRGRRPPKQIYNMKARGEIIAPVNVPGLGLRWLERALGEWMRSIIDDTAPPRPAKAPRPGQAARARVAAEAATAA